MENITLFFFNIIPGALLIFILENKSNIRVMSEILGKNPKPDLSILWLIIFSIFIAFFLQAFTKWVKEKFLYQIIWCKIKNDDPNSFQIAEKYLVDKQLLSKNDVAEKRVEKMFFTMDNYLSLSGGGRLLTHFASRLAYWSNLFWVSLIIIVLALMRNINDTTIIICAIIVFVMSTILSWVHLKNHYDILLKSFISDIVINKKSKL